MSEHSPPPCPDCGAALEADGVCLACIFGEALEGKDPAGEAGMDAGSRFGSYAAQEAGTFGKYTLRRKLGAGGMGSVYLASHPRLPRLDAVKVLSAELTGIDAFA